jgi:acetyl-CoA carboxylase biotin carboxyl carrier protein
MRKRKLEELIQLVEDSDIQELSVSGPFTSIRISKAGGAPHERVEVARYVPPRAKEAAPALEEEVETPPEAPDRDSGLVPIVSPMVGTFYAAPSPESPPYVRQGDHINKGQVVCIVEAMKLMNEIESEVSGTIVRAAAENAQPVEYGQALFLVQPD